MSKIVNNKKTQGIVSYGNLILPPVVPGVEVADLCKRIDDYYSKYPKTHKRVSASDLIKGAFFAIRPECRSNLDWMSQAANSVRDVLYPLLSVRISSENLIKLFVKYADNDIHKKSQENKEFIHTFSDLNLIYKKVSDFTHHGTDLKAFTEKQFIKFSDTDFENLMNDFVIVLGKALCFQQIYVHKIIDIILNKKQETKSLIGDLNLIFQVNSDAKNYFLNRVNENWIDWLWNNNFLNRIKEKAENPTKYSYAMPELDYLARVAKNRPDKVADIIYLIPISEEIFNPEVIDRFLWIIESLPPKQIQKLSKKIKDEKWVRLMKAFNKSAFEFDKMIKSLSDAKEYDALLDIAEAMLEIDVENDATLGQGVTLRGYDRPFILHNISYGDFFEILTTLEDDYAMKVLKLLADVLAEIIKEIGKEKEGVFEYKDTFSLYNEDIFEINFRKNRQSEREDFENLIVTIKILIEKNCKTKADDVYGIVSELPENRVVWKLKIFTISQSPESFKVQLRPALFRIFNVGEMYFEIENGAEYHQFLVRCFDILDQVDQREYVKNVFEYFNAKLNDTDKEKLRRHDGGQILCFIKDYLTPEEKKEAKDVFNIDTDKEECRPTPAGYSVSGGAVTHKSPDKISDFTIEQIIEKLKTEYTPDQLQKKYEQDDFLSPRGPEGLGDALKEDLKIRTNEYLERFCEFFDREKIHPHYLYSILRGIEDMYRDKKIFCESDNEKVLNLFEIIRESGERDVFERQREKNGRSWLADWVTVHKVISDVLLQIINNSDTGKQLQIKNREKIFSIIQYLLSIQGSPEPREETGEYGELFHVAINSVRGRAYECFVVFTQNESNELADDIKELYKQTLNDTSLVIRFVVGRYLPTFYFRDKDFIGSIFSEIFPKDESSKKDLFMAAWEGYLSTTLYDKLFKELEDYYRHAIELDPRDYTNRKYNKGLDESLAIHLALAFVYLGLNIGDPLFEQFWSKKNIKRHHGFISFIGSSCLTRSQAGDEWLKANKFSKEKLIDFWDWILNNENINDPEVLSAFGMWINPDREVLDEKIIIDRIAKILVKSDGAIGWDHGLTKRMTSFAEINGQTALKIISSYLLGADGNLNRNRRVPMLHRGELKRSLEIIYSKGDDELKQKVKNLINTLIEKGSSMYWGLKDIIN